MKYMPLEMECIILILEVDKKVSKLNIGEESYGDDKKFESLF